MLDSDLAQLYQVETRTLNQSVKRNIKRFPEHYRFQITRKEYEDLKSQNVISSIDEKFDKVFQYIEDHAEDEQKFFFDGQIYDAFSLIASLIQKAQKEIILIDGYVDVGTLNLLAKKNTGVDVKIYTYSSAKLTETRCTTSERQLRMLGRSALEFHFGKIPGW